MADGSKQNMSTGGNPLPQLPPQLPMPAPLSGGFQMGLQMHNPHQLHHHGHHHPHQLHNPDSTAPNSASNPAVAPNQSPVAASNVPNSVLSPSAASMAMLPSSSLGSMQNSGQNPQVSALHHLHHTQQAQHNPVPAMQQNMSNLTAQQQQQMAQNSTIAAFWQDQIQQIDKETDFKNHELPLARIKKVMKTDDDVKGMMISAEAPVLFAKACEMFILELTMRAWVHTEENKRRTLQRNDIAMAITKTDVFDFLIDIVPREDMKPMKKEGMGGDAVYFVPPQMGMQYVNPRDPMSQHILRQQMAQYIHMQGIDPSHPQFQAYQQQLQMQLMQHQHLHQQQQQQEESGDDEDDGSGLDSDEN